MSQFAPINLTGDNNLTWPYVASASSEFSGTFAAWKAFSNSNGSTYWVSTASTGYLQIDLGVDNNGLLTSYSIMVDTIPEPTRAPQAWTMEGSNDGSSFTTLDTQSGQTSWTSGQTRTFTIGSPGTTYYRFFRLNITANNGAGNIDVANLLLYGTPGTAGDLAPHNMTSNSAPSPYVASASSFFGSNDPFRAFSGATSGIGFGDYWIGTGNGVDYLQLDLGSGNQGLVTEYYIQASLENENTRLPKNWTLQGSNDNVSWTTLDTETNQTGWTVGLVRGYPASGSTYYRYFRLNITANNGAATYTDVGQLYLIGTLNVTGRSFPVCFVVT